MARSSKVNLCLICNEVPCSCGKPRAPKVTKPAKPKPEPVSVLDVPETVVKPVSKISALDAMRARAASDSASGAPMTRAWSTAPKARRAATDSKPVLAVPAKAAFVLPDESDEDSEFRNALEALAPLLHPDELKRFEALLPQPELRTVSQRARDWRRRAKS